MATPAIAIQPDAPTTCWRMRMKYRDTDDVTKAAWEQGVVGIWYGAWNARQFEATLGNTRDEAMHMLSAINATAELTWSMSRAYVDTARRFWAVRECDWVFTYFDDSIHLARVFSDVERESHPQFSRGRELFKYRAIGENKSFNLGRLPDCFRLLSSAGQGNVHEVWGTRPQIELLATSASEAEVWAKYRKLSWKDWLDALGPYGWEALCLGYLIFEKEFVPTGLDVGRTLPLIDLLGRARTGERIYAQCKKNPSPMSFDDGFVASCRTLSETGSMYVFAYSGCANAPADTTVVTGSDLEKWFEESENGKLYMRLLRG